MRLPVAPNIRECWQARAARARKQRETACLRVANAIYAATGGSGKIPAGPLVVRLCREGPRRVDDDNLAGAFKAVRDGVADALGVDDGDTNAVRWEYRQDKARACAVSVEIRGADDRDDEDYAR
jgi:crossover junction endodeoxyribonuclease RusA